MQKGILLNDVKPYDIHNGRVFVAPDLFYSQDVFDNVGNKVPLEDARLYHESWIGRDDKRRNPHWHCLQCYGEDWMIIDFGQKVCKKCYSEGKIEKMLLCTPVICGSS